MLGANLGCISHGDVSVMDEWRKYCLRGSKIKRFFLTLSKELMLHHSLSILKVISNANHTILICHRDSIFRIQVVAKNLLHLLQQSY